MGEDENVPKICWMFGMMRRYQHKYTYINGIHPNLRYDGGGVVRACIYLVTPMVTCLITSKQNQTKDHIGPWTHATHLSIGRTLGTNSLCTYEGPWILVFNNNDLQACDLGYYGG